jgi:hypothetical protein
MADDIKATEENLISAMDRMQKQFEAISTGMAGMAMGFNKHAKALGLDENELKKLTEATGRARIVTEQETEAEKALAESKRIAKERQDAYNESLKKGTVALGSFGAALLENNVKLSNYGDAVSKAGDAAFEFGKSISPLGAVIGAVVKGATMLAEAQLKQADALLGAKDELTKIGGAGAHTTESIRKMAREADLNSETLGRMVKPMKDMGSSIMILGSSAGNAQKEMAGLMKATAEERAMFSRLGMTQEDMMKGTSDYIALQSMSGRMTKSELQDKEKLRKASQDYQMNLLDLAAITGKDVAELKEKQKEMALDAQLQIDNIQKNRKAAKLRDEATAAEQAGDKERAKALRASAQQLDDEVKNRGMVMDNLADAPDALKKGIKEILTTGSLSGENARILAKMGMTGEAERLAKAIKSGAMSTEQAAVEAAKSKDKFTKQQGEMIDTMGDSLKFSEDLRKSQGVTTDSIKFYNEGAAKQAEGGFEAATKKAQADRKAAQASGQDNAADARAAAQNATIAATGAMDDLVAATNPLIGEFNLLKGASLALTAAAGAAAVALGVLAAKKGIGDIAGALGKTGGASGAVSGAAQTAASGASKIGSALKTGGKLLGKAATPLAIGMAAYEGYSDYKSADEKLKKGEITEAEAKKEKGKAVGSATGSAAGGVAGAVIGQMLIPIPGVGAAIGGLAGSWLGGKMGSWAGGKAGAAAGATPAGPGIPGATPVSGAPQTSKPGEQKPEDKVKDQEQKSSAEEISSSLQQVAKQVGLMNVELKQNTKQLKDLNEQFKKYNDQFTAQTEALDPDKMADSLKNAVGGIGGQIKTAMNAAMGGQAGGAGGAAPFTVSRMSMSRTGGPGSAGGGGSGGAGGAMPAIGNIPGIPERKLGPIIPGGMNMAGGGGGGTMPTIDAGTGPAVKGSPKMPGGDPTAAIASALPSGSGGPQGSKQPAGPVPTMASGGGGEADKKGPPGGKFKDKEEFVKVMMPWAEYAAKQLGAPALGILGQWAGESGAGKSLPADFNYAGIKAGNKFAKGDYVLTEERYNQKQLERAMKSGESLAGVIDSPGDTIKKKGRDVTIDQWYGAGAYDKAANEGLNWVQVKSYFAKFNDLKDFTDSYIGFLKNPRYADALKAGSAEDFGYAVAKAGYATASADKYASKVGSFAKSLSAREGGLAMGPNKGYAATLHGNEIIIPLDPNSILADLGKKSKAEAQSEMKRMAESPRGAAADSSKELVAVNTQMMEMLATKLDSVIDKLESSNATQGKILKHSQA